MGRDKRERSVARPTIVHLRSDLLPGNTQSDAIRVQVVAGRQAAPGPATHRRSREVKVVSGHRNSAQREDHELKRASGVVPQFVDKCVVGLRAVGGNLAQDDVSRPDNRVGNSTLEPVDEPRGCGGQQTVGRLRGRRIGFHRLSPEILGGACDRLTLKGKQTWPVVPWALGERPPSLTVAIEERRSEMGLRAVTLRDCGADLRDRGRWHRLRGDGCSGCDPHRRAGRRSRTAGGVVPNPSARRSGCVVGAESR